MLLANVALPSFLGHWVVFTILLPLVAIVEGIVLKRVLKLEFVESLNTAISANWRSTIVGLPAGWLLAFVGLVPAGILAYFLPVNYRDPAFQIIAFTTLTGGVIPSKYNMVALAAGNLLILMPYYVATVRVERKKVEELHPDIDPEQIALAVRLMNRITYSILAVEVSCWLIAAIVEFQNRAEPSLPGTGTADVHNQTDHGGD